MCAGHSLHKADWLKIAAALAATGVGAGAAGIGPLAGLMGAGGAAAGAGAVAGDAYLPGALSSLALEGGPGAAAGGLAGADEVAMGQGGRSLLGQGSDLVGKYGPKAAKFGKAAQGLQASGLLGGQQRPQVPIAPPPGGGPQMPGAPTSAQIAFPDAFQPQQPNYPLDEILRKRLLMG